MFALLRKAFWRLIYPINPYWTASIYGFGKWIRVYGYYPPILPLCIYTDHGPGALLPSPHELESDAPFQFYHSTEAVMKWKALSCKGCYTLYSPFVFARNQLGIEYDSNAKGSVFFVAHNTPSVIEKKTVISYHKEISSLPRRYHPITICLHIHDVRKGLDKKYKELGYRVETAGDSLSHNFTENFYRLLSQHKYCFSNHFGSYALYATEMGMPFGLFGSEPDYVNVDDPNIPKGKYIFNDQSSYINQAQKLFGGLPNSKVNGQQLEFAKEYLGLNSGVGRTKMAAILYKGLWIWIFEKIKRLLKIMFSVGRM